MDRYIVKDNKKLAYGYTTGTCAAAASYAATKMLLNGEDTVNVVKIMTPKGFEVEVLIENILITNGWVSCAVRKDAGDDPDVTNKLLIYSKVMKRMDGLIVIDGGIGVGRITKKGLEQPVGAAAINMVPRKMILESVQSICEEYEYEGGLDIVISIPGGEEIAQKTFNPRLGIVGGLSILGTSGIVEPMSEQALIDTIRVEMQIKKEEGNILTVVPGNYGQDFLKREYGLDIDTVLKCSNYVGETIDMCRELGFEKMLFTGHLGKLSKVAGGTMNTHSKYGDGRMVNLARFAETVGTSKDVINNIMECTTCDAAIEILMNEGICNKVMKITGENIINEINKRSKNSFEAEVIIFSNVYGMLYMSKGCMDIIKMLKENN